MPLDREKAHLTVRHEAGQVCCEVLRDTGVYKQDQEGKFGLQRFLVEPGMPG